MFPEPCSVLLEMCVFPSILLLNLRPTWNTFYAMENYVFMNIYVSFRFIVLMYLDSNVNMSAVQSERTHVRLI